MNVRNFTPHGPADHPAPLRVRLNRIQWAKNDLFRDRGLCTPRDVEAFRDIPYGPLGQWHLMDLYRPKGVPTVLPVIVSIHGGGYFYGDKELYSHYCMNLAQRGFGVVNFNYRLAPEYRFPAPLEDINRVFIWLMAHGAEYGLDIHNLFVVGDSAGAQLASQYAAICTAPGYAALFDFTLPAIRIRALGLNCGMYDILHRTDPIMLDYLGDLYGSQDPRLDVLPHINAHYPPTYLMSAHCDFLLEACAPMAELLRSRGVEAEYKIYGSPDDPSVGHVFHENIRLPEGKQGNADQMAFFRKHLVKK